jgi:hemerythrin
MHDAMPVAEIVRTLQYDYEQLREVGGRILQSIECCDVERARDDLLEFQILQDGHFWFQNRLMEAAAYPDLEEHIRCHERLHTVLLAINRVLCSGRFSALTSEVARFIEESLSHIDEMDDPFEEFLIRDNPD